MATVTIGGRAFVVVQRQDAGGLGRMKRIAQAEAALGAAKTTEFADRMAELVRCYIAEEVTAEELLAVLPFDCGEVLKACIVASGGQVTEGGAKGEAKTP
jgi:hypothetical protein